MINKRDYPWPGRPLLSHGDLDELVDAVNHSLDNEGGIQRYHNNTVVESSRELPMYMAVMMTQAQLDTHFGEDEEDAGLRQRNHPKLGSEESADDDMYSAWCAVLQLSSKTNARYARLREPVLVYFPQLGLFDDEASFAGCEPVNPNEILPIFYNQSDDRWEAIRPTKQGDQMDVVTVCDASRPVESCDEGTKGSGDTEGQFCCLFDAVAFRILPDCEDEGNYYCSPDNEVFDIWLYAPDKRALPPEGISDWGRRVQDAYTVQNWMPFGVEGPTLSSTRPVYQVAAVTCNCPRDTADIRLWCEMDTDTEYRNSSVPLREVTLDPDDVPVWDFNTTYDIGDFVWYPDRDDQLYRAIQSVPEDYEPEGPPPNWDEYWTEASIEDGREFVGEFCITHTMPVIASRVDCGEGTCDTYPDDVAYVIWDSVTGEPKTVIWDTFPWVTGVPGDWPGFVDDFKVSTGSEHCILASSIGHPSYTNETTENVTSCYRISFRCIEGANAEFGYTSSISHVRLYHILPDGHYAETALGIESGEMSDPNRELAGPLQASEVNACIGRTMGEFRLTSFSTQPPPPQDQFNGDPNYTGSLRYTPHLIDHCFIGCGNAVFDHSPLPDWSVNGDYDTGDYVRHSDSVWKGKNNPLAGEEPGVATTKWDEVTDDVLEWCACGECNCRDVYFQLTFNCNLQNPI